MELKTLYHGSSTKINKFVLDFVGSGDGLAGGVGVYFTDSKAEALQYGMFIHTCQVKLLKPLSNDKLTFTKSDIRELLKYYAIEQLGIEDVENMNKFETKIFDETLKTFSNVRSDRFLFDDLFSMVDEYRTEFLQQIFERGYNHFYVNTLDDMTGYNHYILFDMDAIEIIDVKHLDEM